MKIRDLTIEDYGVLTNFLTELHLSHHRAIPHIFKETLAVPSMEAYAEELQDPNCLFFGVEKDGELTGFCQLNIKENPDIPEYPIRPARVAHIEHLYTAPAFRRQGIATALLEEAKRRAQEHQAAKLTLMVWDFNRDAIALYQKFGMVDTFHQMEELL